MFLIDIDNIVLIFLRWEEILYLGSYKSWCRFGGWGLKVVIKSLLPSYKKQFSKKMMKLLIETWSDDDIDNFFLKLTSCQRWKSSCCWDFDTLCTWSLSKQYYTCCYGILSFVRLDKSCSIKIYSGPWATSLTWFLKKKSFILIHLFYQLFNTRKIWSKIITW